MPVERQGLTGAAQLSKTVGQRVEADKGAGVLLAEDPLAGRQGLLVEGQCLAGSTEFAQATGQIANAGEGVRMISPEDPLAGR